MQQKFSAKIEMYEIYLLGAEMLTYQTIDSPFIDSITIHSTGKEGNPSLTLKTKQSSDDIKNFQTLIKTKSFFGVIYDDVGIKELDLKVTALDIDNYTVTVEAKNFEPIFRKMATRSVITGPTIIPLITNELCETLINALPKKQTFENEELDENTAPNAVQSPRTSSLTGNPASFHHHHKPKETPVPHSNKCSPQASPESLSPITLIKSH